VLSLVVINVTHSYTLKYSLAYTYIHVYIQTGTAGLKCELNENAFIEKMISSKIL